MVRDDAVNNPGSDGSCFPANCKETQAKHRRSQKSLGHAETTGNEEAIPHPLWEVEEEAHQNALQRKIAHDMALTVIAWSWRA